MSEANMNLIEKMDMVLERIQKNLEKQSVLNDSTEFI